MSLHNNVLCVNRSGTAQYNIHYHNVTPNKPRLYGTAHAHYPRKHAYICHASLITLYLCPSPISLYIPGACDGDYVALPVMPLSRFLRPQRKARSCLKHRGYFVLSLFRCADALVGSCRSGVGSTVRFLGERRSTCSIGR